MVTALPLPLPVPLALLQPSRLAHPELETTAGAQFSKASASREAGGKSSNTARAAIPPDVDNTREPRGKGSTSAPRKSAARARAAPMTPTWLSNA